MGYLDNKGLEHYSWLVRNKLAKNDQMTRMDSLVQFCPAPETELEPIVDFIFTKIPPAEGEKSPSNPSVITGVESINVVRCGKNILPSEPLYTRMSQRGITVTKNVDGSYHFSGTSDSNATPFMDFFATEAGTVSNALERGKTITILITCSDSNVYGTFYDTDSDSSIGDGYNIIPGTSFTHTIGNNSKSLLFQIKVSRNKTIDCDVYCQIEYGNTATEWEAPADDTYTLVLGSTYYGGSVNFKTGEMTVTHISSTITGQMTFSFYEKLTNTVAVVATLSDLPINSGSLVTENCLSDRFSVNGGSTDNERIRVRDTFLNKQFRIYISYERLGVSSSATNDEIVAAAKAWFSENPTKLILSLAPVSYYTVQLTPVQIFSLAQSDKYVPQINTVYSDQQSVRVGFERDDVVHRHGDEIIYGYKQFHSTISLGSSSNAAERLIIGSVTDGIRIGAESMAMSRHGGMLTLYGKTATSTAAGNFVLHATNTSGSHALTGRPDGTLTWRDKDITGDVHTTGNETIGGRKHFSDVTTFGSTSNAYEALVIASVTGAVRIAAENYGVSSRGAGLQLFGRSAPTDAGQFTVFAANATGDKNLIGKPDGTLTWNGQSIQTSSDERVKTSLSEVPDEVLDAWEDVNWGQFQYLDAVKEKGSSARLHLGLIAQHVMAVFEKHGLDACAYGILCHEEREAAEDSEAVDLWMVRYAEAQAMEAACLRRGNARLKARLDALEERLAALEMK